MRSLFKFIIAGLILSACSQTPASVTSTPLPSITPTSISTVTPTFSPTFTPTPLVPDLTPAQQAEFEKDYGGVLKVTESGAVTDADGNLIEVFAYNPELGTLTWKHFSPLLGREIIEPISGIVKYEKGADGKLAPTGEIDFSGCFYRDKVCSPEHAIDPTTDKEVEGALKHSIFEVMMLQLQDMAQMTEQDKENAADLDYDRFIKLAEPNDSFSNGQRYWVYKDANGVSHSWPLDSNQRLRNNYIVVKDVGRIMGVPFHFYGSSKDGKTGFIVWEVNGLRRELFIDTSRSIINVDVDTDIGNSFVLDEEWLSGEFEIKLFD